MGEGGEGREQECGSHGSDYVHSRDDARTISVAKRLRGNVAERWLKWRESGKLVAVVAENCQIGRKNVAIDQVIAKSGRIRIGKAKMIMSITYKTH